MRRHHLVELMLISSAVSMRWGSSGDSGKDADGGPTSLAEVKSVSVLCVNLS